MLCKHVVFRPENGSSPSLCISHMTAVAHDTHPRMNSVVKANSHRAKANAKVAAKRRSKDKWKRSKIKRQTSKKIFLFAFAFSWSVHCLTLKPNANRFTYAFKFLPNHTLLNIIRNCVQKLVLFRWFRLNFLYLYVSHMTAMASDTPLYKFSGATVTKY